MCKICMGHNLISMAVIQMPISSMVRRSMAVCAVNRCHARFFLFACCFTLKSTAMVMAGRSVHLTTLFPGQA